MNTQQQHLARAKRLARAMERAGNTAYTPRNVFFYRLATARYYRALERLSD